MLLLLKRICANIIDIILFFVIFVLLFLYVYPAVSGFVANPTIAAVVILLLIIALVAVVQYPFLLVHQTVGKAFFRLKIISTNQERPMTPSIVLQREVFCKVATGYLLCAPVFFAKQGVHEAITETEVISA